VYIHDTFLKMTSPAFGPRGAVLCGVNNVVELVVKDAPVAFADLTL
jgi:hypothetical protein